MASPVRSLFFSGFLLLLLILAAWGIAPAPAGTTGTLIGYVLTDKAVPVQAAKVAAASASQTASTTTDVQGHFVFVSLIPDTYVVTVTKDGYRTVSQPGVEIAADNTQTVELITAQEVRTIGRVII